MIHVGIPVPGYWMSLKARFLTQMELHELHAMNCRSILQL